jgi:hypothetical protein
MLKITLPVPVETVSSFTKRRATANDVWLARLVREDYRRRRLTAAGCSPGLIARFEAIRAEYQPLHLEEMRETQARLRELIPLAVDPVWVA